VELVSEGDISGSQTVSIPALSTPEVVSLPVDTSVAGTWSGTVTLTSISPETQTTPEVINLTGEVIEHANASFAYSEDIDWYVYDISFEENSGIQTFNVWVFNYGFDGSQSLLEIDEVTIPEPPIIFGGISTTSVGSIPALMEFSIDTNAVLPKTYTSLLPITVSDEDLPGEATNISMLTVRIEIVPSATCVADIAGNDGVVDIEDLLVLISEWDATDSVADISGEGGIPDGTVDISDLLALIGAWGICP